MKYGNMASYSAMSSKEALDLCPYAIFISEIGENNEKWANRFVRFLSAIQISSSSMSIDEAYLDVTENKIQSKSAVKIAPLDSACDLGRTTSPQLAGEISYNRFLAGV